MPMYKYLITFEKFGYIKYTSHLDMVRLFKRNFRRNNIKIAHSQGFNPHPKMSITLPLSLGYSASNEFLEIETLENYMPEDIMSKMNDTLPEGIKVIAIDRYLDSKTVASRVYAADYTITIPVDSDDSYDYAAAGAAFMAQDEILAEKRQKKTGNMVEINIRPLIKTLAAEKVDNNIIMTTNIAQGSNETLSPELIIAAFSTFTGKNFERSEIAVSRDKIIYK